MNIINGNCIDIIKTIEDNSIDCIITEPPYNTEINGFSNVIKFEELWVQFNRILKPNRNIIIICAQPFSSKLIMSNLKQYRYSYYWKHNRIEFHTQTRPHYIFEEICVFGGEKINKNDALTSFIDIPYDQPYKDYYKKPIDLYKHLINLYTQENEMILDCFAGSENLGLACRELNRNITLIELDLEKYNNIKEKLT